MNEQDEKQLEQLVHRELRKLPELPAPETLVHSVMLAVHAKEREPWWQRPWLTWPRPVQVISSALCVATVTAGSSMNIATAQQNAIPRSD